MRPAHCTSEIMISRLISMIVFRDPGAPSGSRPSGNAQATRQAISSSVEVLVVAERPNSRAGVASRREGISLRNVAERSGRGSVGPGFPNRLEDLLDRGLEEEEDPLGHGPSVHLNREFAAVPVHHFHFDSGFSPQCVRQTGGMCSGSGSGRTFSNDYLFHNWPS